MMSFSSRLIRGWIFLLVTVAALSGCGDSQDYVFTGTNGGNANPTGNSLTVNLDTSPVQARISGDATSFEVTVFDSALAEVRSTTISRGQNALFEELPNGTYTIRVVGRDGNGGLVGYFDRVVTLDGDDVSVTIDGLVYASTVPPIGSTDAPFLVITELPDAITGGDSFLVQASAYDANGVLLGSASGDATITSSGLALAGGDTTVAFSNGRATFNDLSYPLEAEGNATLSVTSDVGTATTPAIPVDAGEPVPPEDEPHLVFTTEPSTAMATRRLSPPLQVQLRDENDQPVTDDGVAVTIALASSPNPGEAELTGDLTVETVDGVATFPAVEISMAGSYAITASATGYDSDTTGTIVVSEFLYTTLAVGDQSAYRIRLYDLDEFQNGINNVTPTANIGNDEDTDNNYTLESADDGNAIWYCDNYPGIQLYTNVNDGDDSANNEPARILATPTNDIIDISYDEGRDILYACAGYSYIGESLDRVFVWDDAFTLDNVTANRAITGFGSDVRSVCVDPGSDKLFVSCASNETQAFYVHVFENASTLSGNQANIEHHVARVTYSDPGATFSAMSYDAATDRLWFAGSFEQFHYCRDISTDDGVAAVNVDTPDDDQTWSVFYDPLADMLYVSQGGAGLLFYEDASTINNTQELPDATMPGENSNLGYATGLTLLP